MAASRYTTLLERARRALELGEPIVLDASWSDAGWRQVAAEVARATSSDLVELRCTAPAAVAAERMGRRRAGGGGPSDATPEVAAAMSASADPWPAAVPLDSSGGPEATLEAALAALLPAHPAS